MKSKLRYALLAAACVVLCASLSLAEATAEVKMNLLPSGAMRKVGGYRPQMLTLSADKPPALKKAPQMTAPTYGSLHFGGKSYLIALDEPQGKDAKLYVDANANGDLTDDPATTWKKQTFDTPDGKKLTQYMGSFQVPLQTGKKPTLVSLGAYR